VVDSPTASDESRAAALNNRADLIFADDPAGAIADRSAVLALANTTYDRRYIALIRRGEAHHQLGNEAEAYNDIQTILETQDIAVEQKMAARLIRAEWRIESGEVEEALHDLEVITSSRRNFEDVEEAARRLRQEKL
jgi:hypothetical protein